MVLWQLPRNGRFARLANVLASVFVILGFALAAWTVIPRSAATESGRLYKPASPASTSVSRALPVFVMRPNHSIVRHGTAMPQPDGRLRVRTFASASADYPDATEALLFEPGLSVLWVAATDVSRDELKRRIDAVQDEAARTVERFITSSDFTELYRPVLRSILTDAVSEAWADPDTRLVVEELLAGSDAAFRQMLDGELQAILVDRVRDAVWDMLHANWIYAFGVPFGYDLDYTPVLNAVSTALADPRLRQILVKFGSERLDTAEARRLAERIAIGSVDALMRDRRIPELVSEMVADPRLRQMIAPLSESFVDLFAALPRHLGGLGADSSLNPLAAHVFKAVVLGQETPLVLFVTPEDRADIQRLEPDAATLLQPTSRAGRT